MIGMLSTNGGIGRKIGIILVVILLTASVLFVPQQAKASGLANSSWPMFHGNPQHTGLSPYDASENMGKICGKIQLMVTFESPVIDSDGIIYIGGPMGFYAISEDGNIKWKYEGVSVGDTAAVFNDTIYFGDLSSIYAVDKNGNLKWKYKLDSNTEWPVVLDKKGWVYICSVSGSLYVLDGEGNLMLKYTHNQDMTTPTIAPDGTMFFRSETSLYAMDSKGNILWEFNVGAEGVMPSLLNDTLYLGSGDNYLYAISTNGTLKWKFKAGAEIYTTPAIDRDGNIYFGSNDDYLYAVDKDGAELWKFKTGGSIVSSPIVDRGGNIYFGSDDGYLYSLDSNGNLRWKTYLGARIRATPAIGPNGNIYVPAYNGFLYCIGKGEFGLNTLNDYLMYAQILILLLAVSIPVVWYWKKRGTGGTEKKGEGES